MSQDRRLRFDPIEEASRHWVARDWDEAAAGMATITSVMRVQRIFQARADGVLQPFDLTFARYEVLMLLLFSRRRSLPLGKVGERLQVHPASVTNAIDRLERQRLVRRCPHPTDGRTTLAQITARGMRVAEEATAALNAKVFTPSGLSPRELQTLFRLLRKIRHAAGDF